MSRLLWLILGLMACSGDKDSKQEDSGSVIPGDSADTDGSEEGGETGDSSDSGQDDSGGMSSDAVLTVIPEGDADGLVVGVAQFWVDEVGVEAGELMGSAVVEDGIAIIGLPTPDEADLLDDGSGVLTATYVAFLRRDEDGDGLPGETEPVVGVSEVWLFYIAGELDSGSESFGLQLGWNAILFDLVGDELPVLHDLEAFPLGQNLVAVDSIDFSGGSDVSDTPADPIRLTAIPIDVEMSDDIWTSLVFDEQLSSTWAVEVRDRPHESHFVKDEDALPSALELAIAYVDVDESGDLNGADETLYGVCFGEKPLLLMWIDELRDLNDAITAPLVGLGIGWSGWAIDLSGGAAAERLDEKQLTQLSAEASCSLE
jgi:hypothetical protein